MSKTEPLEPFRYAILKMTLSKGASMLHVVATNNHPLPEAE